MNRVIGAWVFAHFSVFYKNKFTWTVYLRIIFVNCLISLNFKYKYLSLIVNPRFLNYSLHIEVQFLFSQYMKKSKINIS